MSGLQRTLPWLVAAVAFSAIGASSGAAVAEVLVRGIEGGPLHEARPAPTFLQPDHKIVVAQPSPSEINPSFLGPVLLMRSAHIDLEKGTMKVPLYRGKLQSGETVWFALTDSTDENLSNLHGLVYSPKLAYGFTGRNQRTAQIQKDGSWVFNKGKVDFAPKMAVTPGAAPNFFPPKTFQPGAVGDDGYTPIVKVLNAGKDVIFNAPMLAFNVSADELNKSCDGNANKDVVHDKVVSICPRDGWVTLAMTIGYTFGKPILYLSTEANHPLIATLEGATFGLPAVSSGSLEVEFAGDEIGYGGEVAERAVAAGLGLGGLDEGVDALDEAVGNAAVEPGEDTVGVATERGGDGLHRLEP